MCFRKKLKKLVVINEQKTDDVSTIVLDLEKSRTENHLSAALYEVTYNLKPHKKSRGSIVWKVAETKLNNDKILVDKTSDILYARCRENNNATTIIDGQRRDYVEIVFNPNSIKDCIDRTVKSFVISYKLIGLCEDKTEKSINGTLTVVLNQIQVEPVFLPMFDDIMYENTTVRKELGIRNSSILHYAPNIGLKITDIYLETGRQRYDDIIKIHNSEAKPTIENPGLIPEGEEVEFMTNDNIINLLPPEAGYSMNVPFTMDLSKLPNPVTEHDNYTLVINYVDWVDGNNNVSPLKREEISFKILQNDQIVDLQVCVQSKTYNGFQTDGVVTDNDYRITTDKPVSVNKNATTQYRVVVKNTATVIHPERKNAAIIIRNFINPSLSYSDGYMLYTQTNESVDIDNICHMQCSGKDFSAQEIKLMPGEAINIDLVFQSDIKNASYFNNSDDKMAFTSDVVLDLDFSYYKDEKGNGTPTDGEFIRFQHNISKPIEIEPKEEWLGLDFGTSAIVALYGNGLDDQARHYDCILNLEEIKEKGLRRLYRENRDYQENDDERVFVNSNIVIGEDYLKGRSEVEKFEDLKNSKIMLSPGKIFVYKRLIPSLKSMMGYTTVPKSDGKSDSKYELFVDDIYEMAYKQLFKLYLGNTPAEKIVMTYPNTFSACHVKKLREIAQKCMPSLRNDYIVTVSESDAVAYRYLKTRHEFDLIKQNPDIDSNVLVYDMGAGTLDLTYFTNVVRDGIRNVAISGKFGLNKAGNYLDYVLADVIVDICNQNGFTDINGRQLDDYIDYNTGKLDIETRKKLKDYVKQLKLKIADYESADKIPETEMLPSLKAIDGNKLTYIPLREVFNNEKFKKFVEDVSTGVVADCQKAFGFNTDKIVVVFSGRMTSMKIIRSSVKKALKEELHADKVYDIDISKTGNAQLLKTSVINGALNYVENFIHGGEIVLAPRKPFYTRFCIIAIHPNRESVHCIVDNKMSDFTRSERVNMDNISALFLVQTYAVTADDILVDFKGERNLTTVLAYENTTAVSGTHTIAVKVDTNSTDRFNEGVDKVGMWIENSETRTLPHENIHSSAFRKSAWPIIFNKSY